MGLLSGLEALGIGVNTQKITPDHRPVFIKKKKKHIKSEHGEKAFLYEKRYVCPVCDREFEALRVKTSSLKLVGRDDDLRPRYEDIDPLKYDIVFCPRCGYSALADSYEQLMPYQRRWIYEGVAMHFHYENPHNEEYSYDEAYVHYQFALLCAMVGGAKASVKARLCLKMAWLIRGKAETINPRLPVYEKRQKALRAKELEALRLALVGFEKARNYEGYPVAGLGQTALDMLMSSLSMEVGDPETSVALLQGIIASKAVKDKVKEKARSMMSTAMKMISA